MQHHQPAFDEGFEILGGNPRVQAATMLIAPGGKEGGPDNRHRGADQWLYVVSGEGVAWVEGAEVPLSGGTLLLVEHGERHEIRNSGSTPLRTLNLYAPPAYDPQGEPLPSGKP